ncbi:hypothetical protein SUDANB32_01287 [Streptomyces sp. enrichment culture]
MTFFVRRADMGDPYTTVETGNPHAREAVLDARVSVGAGRGGSRGPGG